jgi:hypothetical protein
MEEALKLGIELAGMMLKYKAAMNEQDEARLQAIVADLGELSDEAFEETQALLAEAAKT